MSENYQSWRLQDRFVLRAEEVRLQEEIAAAGEGMSGGGKERGRRGEELVSDWIPVEISSKN
jgi:hypothetical protein